MKDPSDCLTAFIVGAGAVENAWDPVIKALQPFHDFPLTSDGANSFLARLVYLLRWWATSDSKDAKAQLKQFRQRLNQVRSSLGRSIRKAEENKQIRVRPEFQDIVHRIGLSNGTRFMLVTTNWDNVIGTALRSLLNTRSAKCDVLPLHIHGRAVAPNTLYLPTEMTNEPYRDASEKIDIGKMHGSIWSSLERAHRAVVYGLSISPLDAELGQTLACGWSNENLREIDIIAPDHSVIAHRVNLLLDRKRDIVVKGFDPGNLATSVDYTIRRHSLGETKC